MRLAFTRWGLSPAAFWSMSPRELAAALGAGPASAAPDRTVLDSLMRLHPDVSPETIHGQQ